MRFAIACCLGLIFGGCSAGAQAPADIPNGHWARAAATEVVSRGVMAAPSGKFEGDKPITRTELAIALAKFARSFEKPGWSATGAKQLNLKAPASASTGPVTRYELAAVLARVAPFVAHGLPADRSKTFSNSEALPKPAQVTLSK